ncbi:cytochrome-c oxidase [Novosphingobium endophyticum]|uniref:Cytochrome-c oxidase n=1 Tax=Novosphingobium endophyticum TaxID=1955250 RepID=A0A916TVD7_9SPHN|nr:heme-copper oxidase subunit III [Novosphingobium endophyticum]GGC12824.1 cytochrome-c oxidase [Novosphingobium endophyticum]
MSLLRRLGEKSWETPGAEAYREPDSYRPAAATVGVYVYFGVATVIFTLIAAAYLARMGLPAAMEHGAGADWRAMPEPPLLWINSGILVLSSLAWEAARRLARRGEIGRMQAATLAGGGLGLLFLAGQLLLWWHYQTAGYFLSANPANAFFYLLTALHGLHLAGGIAAGVRALGQPGDAGRAARNVRLCAVYWHYLLLVWVLLAGLLVMT